ncbi:MAG: Aerobic carbon monoxide dehydrogenase (quinone), medium chain [uncultured Rubrobacteraceae bacterium]|uniref:Aerobic carbon monoxide dehydrogenase (Quinone), medium chain n=1 Tax=uncultured Rubrobacteraceae bacterium TaxID=349277 RepID=A0A6J4RA64_9ACTN|nr:MAG: Aerobic carbon monoxide dehydrogenase (quinone), medium chain [uncultured Rubrobacteraceae bacterium]
MIPMAFDYEVAESVDHAIDLLGQHGEDSKLLAGGHSLIPIMRLRLAAPTVLIDLGRLEELRYVRDGGDHLAIGAMTRHRDLLFNDLVKEHCGIVGWTAGLLGDPSVQHRGTLGGTLSHGDSSGDMPSVITALEGELTIKGPQGERTVEAADFFQDYMMTDLGEQEVVTEIRVPKLAPGTGWSYKKFSRRSQDWATVGVAAVVERSNGSIGSARIALTSMGATPIRAAAVEQALSGASPDAVAEASQSADEGTNPSSDDAASAEFRRHLARVFTQRAVEEALGR